MTVQMVTSLSMTSHSLPAVSFSSGLFRIELLIKKIALFRKFIDVTKIKHFFISL